MICCVGVVLICGRDVCCISVSRDCIVSPLKMPSLSVLGSTRCVRVSRDCRRLRCMLFAFGIDILDDTKAPLIEGV